jgi:hypothetical protein
MSRLLRDHVTKKQFRASRIANCQTQCGASAPKAASTQICLYRIGGIPAAFKSNKDKSGLARREIYVGGIPDY